VWEACRFVRIRLALLIICVLAMPARAVTVRALSLDELLAHAGRVVHARCASVTPEQVLPSGVPVVEITLAVEETLKGDAAERLVIRQAAGRLSGVLPTCRVGDELLLFLHAPSRLGLTSPVGLGQGYFRIVRAAGRPAEIVGDARLVGALAAPPASAARRGSAPASAARASAPLEEALHEIRTRLGGVR
jgi:hypothetical protein